MDIYHQAHSLKVARDRGNQTTAHSLKVARDRGNQTTAYSL